MKTIKEPQAKCLKTQPNNEFKHAQHALKQDE